MVRCGRRSTALKRDMEARVLIAAGVWELETRPRSLRTLFEHPHEISFTEGIRDTESKPVPIASKATNSVWEQMM